MPSPVFRYTACTTAKSLSLATTTLCPNALKPSCIFLRRRYFFFFSTSTFISGTRFWWTRGSSTASDKDFPNQTLFSNTYAWMTVKIHQTTIYDQSHRLHRGQIREGGGGGWQGRQARTHRMPLGVTFWFSVYPTKRFLRSHQLC